jgi:2-polyprenyl-6-methoxyphenol hydroxylase-like FAD-dependent oxidoreductase
MSSSNLDTSNAAAAACNAFFAKHLPEQTTNGKAKAWKVEAHHCAFCSSALRSAEKELECGTCGFVYCSSCQGKGSSGDCEYCEMEQLVKSSDQPPSATASFCIVGAAIGGCSSALALAKLGYEVHLFERRSEDEMTQGRGGLVLGPQPMAALEAISPAIATRLRDEFSTPTKYAVFATHRGHARMIGNAANDATRAQVQGGVDTERTRLVELLLNECIEHERVHLHFGEKLVELVSADDDDSGVTLTFTKGGEGDPTTVHKADFVVGADGIHSQVRKLVFTKAPTRSVGHWVFGGTVEYDFDMPVSFGSVWGKGGASFVIVETNAKGTATTTGKKSAFWAVMTTYKPAFTSNSAEETTARMLDVVDRHFPGEKVSFIRDLVRARVVLCEELNLEEGASRDALEVREGPKLKTMISKDKRVIILGDAMHAMDNMLGMGAGSALEDSCALGEMLQVAALQNAQYGGDESEAQTIQKGFALWQRRRLNRVLFLKLWARRVWKMVSFHGTGSYLIKYLLFGRTFSHALDESKRNTMLDCLVLYRSCFPCKRGGSKYLTHAALREPEVESSVGSTSQATSEFIQCA